MHLKHVTMLNGFLSQVMAFMLDNASNNDTLVDGVVLHVIQHCISMNAKWARLCCMPHTVHLAALKVMIKCDDSASMIS